MYFIAGQKPKILIIRFSSLGDIIMLSPIFRCIKKSIPDAQIHFLTKEEYQNVVNHDPYIDRVIVLKKKHSIVHLYKIINQNNYTLIYDAHASLRSFFSFFYIQARFKIRFKKNYIRRFIALYFKINVLKNNKRFTERFIKKLNLFGVSYDYNGIKLYYPSIEVQTLTKKQIPEIIYTTKKRWIGIAPGARWKGKRWEIKNFKVLLDLLVKDGFFVAVFGGPGEDFCSQLTKDISYSSAYNFQRHSLTFHEIFFLISQCEVMVSNDSGLMHVADGLSKPTFSIFGPTSTHLGCKPHHPQSFQFEPHLWCRPCSKNGQGFCIRLKQRKCLKVTEPKTVYTKVVSFLQNTQHGL